MSIKFNRVNPFLLKSFMLIKKIRYWCSFNLILILDLVFCYLGLVYRVLTTSSS